MTDKLREALEREQFEEEVRRWLDPARADVFFARDGSDNYEEWGVMLAWECWKARAALAAPSAEPVAWPNYVELIDKMSELDPSWNAYGVTRSASVALAQRAMQQLLHKRGACEKVPDYRHVANEWADMATNGLQWLRNIVDGISDPKEALANMEDNAKHCQQVSEQAYITSLATPAQPPAAHRSEP